MAQRTVNIDTDASSVETSRPCVIPKRIVGSRSGNLLRVDQAVLARGGEGTSAEGHNSNPTTCWILTTSSASVS